MNRRRLTIDTPPRRGTLLPAIALAILVVGSALALVVDRLWLDAARTELRTAAEAAALAAAGRLADDDRLNLTVAPQELAAAARWAGAEAAADNRVGIEPLRLHDERDGEIRFGVVQSGAQGEPEFFATDEFPTDVSVLAVKARAIGNPVARLFRAEGGDAVTHVAATLNNHIVGLRPFRGANVPALPVAILESDPSGERTDTWAVQIEAGVGNDRYGFNRITRQVESQPDGLPEILLHFQTPGRPASEANVQWVDVGNGFIPPQLVRQIQSGWEPLDLSEFDGVFPAQGSPSLRADAGLEDAALAALSEIIGQKRIVLLSSGTAGSEGRITLARLAAGRVMAIETSSEGTPLIVLQPSVVSTRTALVDPNPAGAWGEEGNPYIYKVYLTQ